MTHAIRTPERPAQAPTAVHRGVARDLAALDVDDILFVLRRSGELADLARSILASPDDVDELAALARTGGAMAPGAIELLGALHAGPADTALIELLHDGDALARRHAAWRLGRRPAGPAAVPALLDLLALGGIDTLHAHRTLRRWAGQESHAIVRHATDALAALAAPAERARLVDLIGVLPDRSTDQLLVELACDRDEPDTSRIAAIGALSERAGRPIDAALDRLARLDDEIGAHAALALQPVPPPSTGWRSNGLRIAQLSLAGGLDGQLSRGGRGETGGVASLLVSLGSALGRRSDVDHVVTIGRGSVHDALVGPIVDRADPWTFGTITFGDATRPAPDARDAWEHLPAIERGVRRALRLAGQVDVLHLRMADAGTLAGADVASAAGVPICFSLAPDPHNVIQSLQSRGELDAERFTRLELDQHLWFRARLIERLGRDAASLALFQRARQFEFFDDSDPEPGPGSRRTALVAEGIDLAAIRRAEDEHASGTTAPVLAELASRLPHHRAHLPLLISVGRLHPVKGMERVTEAWAADAGLRASCNLVVVGGDLAEPSSSERDVIDAIGAAVERGGPDAGEGIVLLGGRPHADIARLLVGADTGREGGWAPGGVYVDGALKEEFGLAILEAMAAGLVVVAPSTGGPSTYVADGDTGVLVDPGADLAAAIRTAFGLVDRHGRRAHARAMIETRYSVETMAAQLVALYEPVAA